MKHIISAIIIAVSISGAANAKTLEEMFPGDSSLSEEGRQFFKDFDFQQGNIKIPAAKATLNVPANFYYLSPADTRKVIVDVWGNPPASAEDNLGMLFPAKYLPSDEASWGSVIQYDADGYVSDAEANATDYDDLLKEIKAAVAERNKERQTQGFEPVTLVGWASPPHYDQPAHALHWARDLIFGNDNNAEHTLNYSIRILGREGVLQLNFVAGMSQLAEIKETIPTVTRMIAFDTGAAYADYRSGDKIAAYGMAGMIAAGAGAKIAAKVGLFAAILAILKKGGIFIVFAGLAGGWRLLKGLFTRNKTPTN